LYRQLAKPYDLVHWNAAGKTMKIEPFPRRIDGKARTKQTLKLIPIDENGKPGKEVKAETVRELRSIEPFESLASERVKDFVTKAPKDDPARRFEALQAAERALAAVIGNHESAREQGKREGEGWDTPLQQLRKQLTDVQLGILRTLAEDVTTQDKLTQDKNWNLAFEIATRYAETHLGKDTQDRFAKAMAPFVTVPLDGLRPDYAEAKKRQMDLQALFPASSLTEQVSTRFERVAGDLMRDGQKAEAEGRKAEAIQYFNQAGQIYPRLHGLRDSQLRLGDAYKIVNVGVRSLPQYLTPDFACTGPEWQAVEFLFESLLKPRAEPDKGTRYYTCLAAERPRQVSLGRDFALSREAFWSDNKPVTAGDVSSSFQRLQKQSDADSLIDEVLPGDDPYHLSVTLKQGYLDPLALMTFKVLPADRVRGRQEMDDFARHPVCSGPYCFHKRERFGTHDAVSFITNHSYRRSDRPGMPYIQMIRFYVCDKPAADFATLRQSDRLHLWLDFPTPRLKELESAGLDTTVTVHTLRNRRIFFLAVNHRKPGLNDERLRRALAHAIDREKILNEVFRPNFKDKDKRPHRELNGPYPPGSWAYDPSQTASLSKPELAKIMADKARAAVGAIGLTLAYPDDDPAVKEACERIRAQVKDHCGIELKLEAVSPYRLREMVEKEHSYQLAYYHHDYPDETYNLWPLLNAKNMDRPGGCNYLGYKPDESLMTELIKAQSFRDVEQVKKHTHEVHRHFAAQVPFIPLWQLDTHIAIHRDVTTYPANVDALDPLRVFKDVERWQMGKDR
jgi:ABC-type transport system substrate-binding protein